MQVNGEGAGCGHLCAASSAHSPNANFAPHLHPLVNVFPQEKLEKQQQQGVLTVIISATAVTFLSEPLLYVTTCWGASEPPRHLAESPRF